jgi:hypothetical protein
MHVAFREYLSVGAEEDTFITSISGLRGCSPRCVVELERGSKIEIKKPLSLGYLCRKSKILFLHPAALLGRL